MPLKGAGTGTGRSMRLRADPFVPFLSRRVQAGGELSFERKGEALKRVERVATLPSDPFSQIEHTFGISGAPARRIEGKATCWPSKSGKLARPLSEGFGGVLAGD